MPVPEENQDPPAPEQNEDTPATFRLRRNAGKGLTEIDDEEVPLAKAPKTGDSSLILAAISVLTGMGFAGVGFTTRCKEQ